MMDSPRPDGLDRRSFLAGSGLLSLGPLALDLARQQGPKPKRELLPTPDLSDERILRRVVGIRPYRRRCFRLELDEEGRRALVHSYGHGGAGFTLSWGCAGEVADLLQAGFRPPEKIAVLGAGVMGLTTAWVLRQRGHGVRLYARELPPETTSDLAGAQWAPAAVERGSTPAENRRYDRILQRAWKGFERLAGPKKGWGVLLRPTHVCEDPKTSLKLVPPGTVAKPLRFNKMPFEGPKRTGWLYRTFLIEPPVFLPRLLAEVRGLGVEVVQRSFETRRQLDLLEERAAVVCLGMGARKLFDDRFLMPLRGQLVHLEPQSLPYMLNFRRGILIPRRDALVVGGTEELDVSDPEPDPKACRAILERYREFFGVG